MISIEHKLATSANTPHHDGAAVDKDYCDRSMVFGAVGKLSSI